MARSAGVWAVYIWNSSDRAFAPASPRGRFALWVVLYRPGQQPPRHLTHADVLPLGVAGADAYAVDRCVQLGGRAHVHGAPLAAGFALHRRPRLCRASSVSASR